MGPGPAIRRRNPSYVLPIFPLPPGELAAHLVDGVLGGLPIRQWVLTLPYRLRYKLAYDHRLCRAVLAAFVRAVLGFERRRAREQGVDGAAAVP